MLRKSGQLSRLASLVVEYVNLKVTLNISIIGKALFRCIRLVQLGLTRQLLCN
jgi:hypothetical protein